MSDAGSSRRVRWLAVTLVALAILLASVVRLPGGGRAMAGPLGLAGLDKWMHALAYAALAGTLVLALRGGVRSDLVAISWVLVGTIAYGFAIELLQLPLPYRSFDVADVIANGAGVATVVVAWQAVARLGRGRDATAPP